MIICLCSLMYGCATAPPPEKPVVYPPLPEDPRIVYLKSYQGDLDFRMPSIFDHIFGAPSGSSYRKPYGVSAHADKIYITDGLASVVYVEDTKNKTVGRLRGSGAGVLTHPVGVTVAADGTIFVTDSKAKQIFGYDERGELKIAIGKKNEFKNIGGIEVNNNLGRLYVVDSYDHCVRVYSVKGESLFVIGRPGFGNGEFNYPTNVAIDRRNDNVYVVDTQNFRVQVFDKNGTYLKQFGGLGDAYGSFSRPKGIGIDSEGHIYVVDAAFANFQIFDETGALLLGVGRGGGGPGEFMLPAGLYVDENDRIYVVDSGNLRVQMFQYLSEKWKKGHPEEYLKYSR